MTRCDAVVALVCDGGLRAGTDAASALRAAMLLDLCEALGGAAPLQVHVAHPDDRGPVRALARGAEVRHTPGGRPGAVLASAGRRGRRVVLVPARAALVTAADVRAALRTPADAVVTASPDGGLALLVADAAAAPALAGCGPDTGAADVRTALEAAGLRVAAAMAAWDGEDVLAAVRASMHRSGPTPAPRTRALLHVLGGAAGA